jgi:tetratricopeptide (TPR) repeat protein
MTDQIRAGRFRRRRRGVYLVSLAVSLLALTAWNLTRSGAILAARQAYSKQDFAGALASALEHLDKQPWSSEAALLAANCLSRLNYANEAERYYRRAGRLELNDLQIRAFGLALGPRPELAIPAYKEILARSPENVTAMRKLAGVLLVDREQTGALLELAERLEQVAGGEEIGARLRGVVYHNDSNPQQAVAAFERVLQLDPDLREVPPPHALFWTELADDLIAVGRIEDASRYLSMAVSKTSDASLLNLLGTTYFLRGAFDDAEPCFRRAAELAPNDHVAFLNLAKLAISRHDPGDALAQLNRARALSPRQYDVLYTLALLYRRLGRTAEADELQQTVKRLREQLGPQPPASNTKWPRYSL